MKFDLRLPPRGMSLSSFFFLNIFLVTFVTLSDEKKEKNVKEKRERMKVSKARNRKQKSLEEKGMLLLMMMMGE